MDDKLELIREALSEVDEREFTSLLKWCVEEIDALRRENEQLREDKARLDFLESRDHEEWVVGSGTRLAIDDYRKGIDAAQESEGE